MSFFWSSSDRFARKTNQSWREIKPILRYELQRVPQVLQSWIFKKHCSGFVGNHSSVVFEDFAAAFLNAMFFVHCAQEILCHILVIIVSLLPQIKPVIYRFRHGCGYESLISRVLLIIQQYTSQCRTWGRRSSR